MSFSNNQYSWCEDNKDNREYLLNSTYCDNAKVIYVYKTNKAYTVKEFKQYLATYNDSPKCPVCGKKLVLRTNKNTEEQFYGCSDFPNCKYTTNA